jgi:hypothetical protein
MFEGMARAFGEGILGPIASIFNKKADVNLEKYKVDGQVSMAAVNAECKIIEAQSKVSRDKWMQWAFVAPTALWYLAIVIDCVFQRITGWKYDVLSLPDQVKFVPMAIIGFLFLYAAVKK